MPHGQEGAQGDAHQNAKKGGEPRYPNGKQGDLENLGVTLQNKSYCFFDSVKQKFHI